MNIKKFVAHIARLTKEFRTYWKHKQRREKQNYPDELSFKEWTEQFIAYLEIKGQL